MPEAFQCGLWLFFLPVASSCSPATCSWWDSVTLNWPLVWVWVWVPVFLSMRPCDKLGTCPGCSSTFPGADPQLPPAALSAVRNRHSRWRRNIFKIIYPCVPLLKQIQSLAKWVWTFVAFCSYDRTVSQSPWRSSTGELVVGLCLLCAKKDQSRRTVCIRFHRSAHPLVKLLICFL